jgi:hypothetical protein
MDWTQVHVKIILLYQQKTRACIGSDSKVHELATVCLPRQQWTETSVWFDYIDMSAFHSYIVVVYLWHLLL